MTLNNFTTVPFDDHTQNQWRSQQNQWRPHYAVYHVSGVESSDPDHLTMIVRIVQTGERIAGMAM